MSTSSTIPLVKGQILTLLDQRASLAEVQRAWSHPGKVLGRESIYFGSVTGSHEIRALRAGHKPRDETYDLEVLVAVHKVGGTVEAAEARAFELLAEIEDVLADDAQIGLGPAVHWARFGEIREVDTGPYDKGNACVIAFTINVRARLD